MKIDWKNFAFNAALIFAPVCLMMIVRSPNTWGGGHAIVFILLSIMLALSQLSRWNAGKKFLYALFVVGVSLPICTSLYSTQIMQTKQALPDLLIISSPFLLAAIAYGYQRVEERLEKYNVRFIALVLVLFGYSFFVAGHLRDFLETSGNTWPGTYYMSFGNFYAVKEYGLMLAILCLIYYFISIKWLKIQTSKKVNMSIVISLAILLEGVFFPSMSMMMVVLNHTPLMSSTSG